MAPSMARRLTVIGAVALVLVAIVVIGGSIGGDETAEPAPMRLGDPGLPLSDPEPAARELPPDFVPNLPAVPTLPEGTHVAHAHGEGAADDDVGDDLSAEMRLLSEARRELPEDPATALVLLDQHRDRYPRGALAEEREAYTILALHALGRAHDVERRYVDFRGDYPTSSFLPTLAEALSHP